MGAFYMLPKIRKPGNPGRPIITGMRALTEQISDPIENILKLLDIKTESFIQDTTDFLNKLNQKNELPENTILVKRDVESMDSNIPHKDGIEAYIKFLSSHKPTHKYDSAIITQLIE
ncbi:Hypothetical predicted protein [Pelobates cultripes]|uniref:Uncharacterized protein n=1 Tax=Pelobates cultripes TaxID=61616 RepID=A0AAD1VRU5_PELCU|nr:Hypothetical predicted protein [Pelobates cultripes]